MTLNPNIAELATQVANWERRPVTFVKVRPAKHVSFVKRMQVLCVAIDGPRIDYVKRSAVVTEAPTVSLRKPINYVKRVRADQVAKRTHAAYRAYDMSDGAVSRETLVEQLNTVMQEAPTPHLCAEALMHMIGRELRGLADLNHVDVSYNRSTMLHRLVASRWPVGS